jgi:hypothetical protein
MRSAMSAGSPGRWSTVSSAPCPYPLGRQRAAIALPPRQNGIICKGCISAFKLGGYSPSLRPARLLFVETAEHDGINGQHLRPVFLAMDAIEDVSGQNPGLTANVDHTLLDAELAQERVGRKLRRGQ